MKRKTKHTHFTIETRMIIEEMLDRGCSVTDISKKLFRDRSNIGREIEKHRIVKYPSSFNRNNPCLFKNTCPKHCIDCFKTCIDFEEHNPCIKLCSSPHVCNGCPNKQCTHVKYYYRAKEADEQYLNDLSICRSKMRYSLYEIKILNNDFYNLVIQTKSIYHSLIVINSRGFNFNIKTIYRQIKSDSLRLKSSDLPRARTSKKIKSIDKTYKRYVTGHTYEDYTIYKARHPEAIEWQMDCVQGIQGADEQVLLTLQIVEIKFLFMFLIKKQTAECVIKELEKFKGYFNQEEFDKLLNILLTDNGHEFIKLDDLMNLLDTTNIYYCHPYSSCEKGSIENNHELIRRVIPQGVSLSNYSQDEINLLCSNINSLFREELNGKCPFDLVENYVSKDILNILGIKKIDPINVTLIPELLGEKNIINIKKYLSDQDIKCANIKFLK